MKDTSLWASVRGHEETINLLRGAIDKKKLAHAYLFYGPRGVGKAKAARVFASAINCADACGRCPSCRGTENLTHPDFHLIEPEGKQGILIDQITSLLKSINLKKHDGNYKIIIIDEAHKLLPAAANALLKTLEEPPEKVIFILVASDIGKVLTTITSRCQPIRFGLLSDEIVRDILIKDYRVPEDKADLVVTLAGGMVGESRELAAGGLLDFRQDMVSLLTAKMPDSALATELANRLVAAAKKRTAKTKKAQEIKLKEALSFFEGSRQAKTVEKHLLARDHRELARKEDQYFQQALSLMTSILRDLLLLSENADTGLVLNSDLLIELKSAKIERSQIRDALADIDKANQWIKQNVSPLLAFENLLFSLEAVA